MLQRACQWTRFVWRSIWVVFLSCLSFTCARVDNFAPIWRGLFCWVPAIWMLGGRFLYGGSWWDPMIWRWKTWYGGRHRRSSSCCYLWWSSVCTPMSSVTTWSSWLWIPNRYLPQLGSLPQSSDSATGLLPKYLAKGMINSRAANPTVPLYTLVESSRDFISKKAL